MADPFAQPLDVLDISLVTFNSAGWLDGFFSSLKAQSFALSRIRILARDNGSSDDSLARLRAYQESWRTLCAGFEIDAGQNIGFGRAHNANLQRGRGTYFLVSNVDLTFESDALIRVLEAAGGDGPKTACWELRQKPFEHPKIYHPASLETLWCSHACILFRRSALVAVGGYEPRLFLYGEDVELSYRLRDRGYTLRYVPAAVCWHHTYRHAREVKRRQFLGSKLANLLLRCRYGTLRAQLAVPLLYAALWLVPARTPQYYRGLLEIGRDLMRLAPHFLATRRQSGLCFPFRGWDYEVSRPGAFVRLPRLPPDPPLVSVITRTVRGRGVQLEAALRSLSHQTYPNVEVIVVEDGSSEARECVETFQTSGRLPQLHYLPLEKLGRCRAGNRGLGAARGKYVCFLDDDDMFYADHLEVLVDVLEAEPRIGAAYALAFEVPSGEACEQRWDSAARVYRVALHQSFSRALLWDHNYLPIQAVLFRRTLSDQLGGFDESLDNLEDWDLWIRYSRHADFQLVERVTSLYTVPSDGSRAYQRVTQLQTFRQAVLEKNAPLWLSLSPPEAAAFRRDIKRYNTVWGLPRAGLRRIALALPFAGPLFHFLRWVGQLITRQS